MSNNSLPDKFQTLPYLITAKIICCSPLSLLLGFQRITILRSTKKPFTPVNMWLQLLWNQVDVFLQQKLVSSSETNYAYKALTDVLLNYGVDAELTQLQTQLFYRDSSGRMDHTDPKMTPLNQELIKRNLLAKNSGTIDMVGPIYADVFQMPRYLLNEVDVYVKLFQNKNPFCLMSSMANKKYKVVINEVILKAAMFGIHPDILKSHARALEDNPALYPLLKTE